MSDESDPITAVAKSVEETAKTGRALVEAGSDLAKFLGKALGTVAGLDFVDVVPAEWDLDFDVEDAANDASGVTTAAQEEAFWDTGNIADAGSGNCADSLCDGLDTGGFYGSDPCDDLSGGVDTSRDGVVHDGICADTACDGVEVTDNAADCTATGAEHTNNSSKGAKKQPDIVSMTAGGLDNEDSCEVTVWVVTDKEHKKIFGPTECPVTLNDGVKVFDASLNLLLQDDDSLIFSDDLEAANAEPDDGIGYCVPAS
jgi:hypothetical protein